MLLNLVVSFDLFQFLLQCETWKVSYERYFGEFLIFADITSGIELKSGQLIGTLTSKRNYVLLDNSTKPTFGLYDPRFLVFEFIHNIMLREAQITLVKKFMSAISDPNKRGEVHQLSILQVASYSISL